LLESRAKLGYFSAMRSHDVIDRLKKAEPALRATGVGALYLFGSHARGEAASDSDVDVFVDPQADETFGFLDFMKAYETIIDAVGPDVEVGYSTRDGLSRYIRDSVEREARRIF
jgi:predicted nucleotidyltransferase